MKDDIRPDRDISEYYVCTVYRVQLANPVNSPPTRDTEASVHVSPRRPALKRGGPKKGRFLLLLLPLRDLSSQLGTQLLETEIDRETKREEGNTQRGEGTCGKLIHVGFNCSKGSPSSVGHLY